MDLADPVDANDHALGPPEARVVVVEYGDFQCPNCRQAAPAVEMLLNRFHGQVRFVYRHFPLEEVHPDAVQAAEAAEAAAAQGLFWPMHRLLFERQNTLSAEHLDEYARQIGLDMDRYTSEMNSHIHVQRIRRDIDSGRRSGVRSTPGFFMNGARQDVSFGLHLLFDGTEAALRRSSEGG